MAALDQYLTRVAFIDGTSAVKAVYEDATHPRRELLDYTPFRPGI
jgi:hypothetical protein